MRFFSRCWFNLFRCWFNRPRLNQTLGSGYKPEPAVNRSNMVAAVHIFWSALTVSMLILLLFFVLFIYCNPLLASEKKEYVLGAHFISASGLGSSQFLDIANVLLGAIAKDYGYIWKIKKYSNSKEVMEAFIKGELDGAGLFPDQAVEIINRGGEFYSLATYTVANKQKRAFCLWQQKGADIKTSSEIIGKTLLIDVADVTFLSLIRLKDVLDTYGINKPFWQVFKSITKIPGQNSSFIALSMGRGDFYWDSDDFDTLLKILNPSVAAKLTHKFCTDRIYARGTILLNKKTVSKKTFEQLSSALKDFISVKYEQYMNSKPEFQSLKQFSKLGKVKFTVETVDFKTEQALYQKAKANGWLKEAEYIAGVLSKASPGQPVEIKPDFGYCKSVCPDEKTMLECIENCLGE